MAGHAMRVGGLSERGASPERALGSEAVSDLYDALSSLVEIELARRELERREHQVSAVLGRLVSSPSLPREDDSVDAVRGVAIAVLKATETREGLKRREREFDDVVGSFGGFMDRGDYAHAPHPFEPALEGFRRLSNTLFREPKE